MVLRPLYYLSINLRTHQLHKVIAMVLQLRSEYWKFVFFEVDVLVGGC